MIICNKCLHKMYCIDYGTKTDQCKYCDPMTNEEWFCGIYTEAKAEWLADHMKCSKCPQQKRCNGYHGGCVTLMLEWLKEEHKNA